MKMGLFLHPHAVYITKPNTRGIDMRKATYLTLLYQENVDFLYNLCRKKTGYDPAYTDLIDECIQETFVLAIKNYSILKDHPNVRAWLVRTCLNRILPSVQKQRNHQRRIAFSLDAPEGRELPGEDELDRREKNQDIQNFITSLNSNLSAEESVIYQAFFLNGCTMLSIAKTHGVSVNKIKNILKRIRRKARSMSKNLFF